MNLPEKTILDYLKEIAALKPDKLLLGGTYAWKSAGDILCMTEAIACKLLALGLHPGDPVLLRATRSWESSVLILAMRAAGLLVVLVDPREDVDELLGGCEAEIPLKAMVQSLSGGGCSIRINGEDVILSMGLEALDTGNAKADAAASDIEDTLAVGAALPQTTAKDPAFVIFTSGSCGKSKAVVLCENNLISNLLDTEPIGNYSKEDIALGALPLVHVFGLVLLAGVFVLEYRLFFPEYTDIPSILSCIQKERITRMNGVPSLYLAMADGCEGYNLSSLRCGFIGGGPVTAEQFARIEEELEMTLISVYGMSECIGISCSDYRDSREIRATGSGKVYPANFVSIRKEDGSEAKNGEEGEIWVTGPMRMLGYYGRPLAEDRLFATGDLGYLDSSGVLHLSGRKKAIIVRNGYNISSRRIEEALLSLPDIKGAAVVGVPHHQQGEVPCAMIVGQADMEKLAKLLHKNELPQAILAVEELPLTSSGKKDMQRIKEIMKDFI